MGNDLSQSLAFQEEPRFGAVCFRATEMVRCTLNSWNEAGFSPCVGWPCAILSRLHVVRSKIFYSNLVEKELAAWHQQPAKPFRQSKTGRRCRRTGIRMPRARACGLFLVVGVIVCGPSVRTSLSAGNNVPVSTSSVRSETAERLKSLATAAPTDPLTTGQNGSAAAPSKTVHGELGGAAGAQDAQAQSRALQEILHERLHWLDEYDRATKLLDEAREAPALDARAALAVNELRQLNETLARAARVPDTLLPAAFPKSGPNASEAMRQIIELKRIELKSWASKLEALVTETSDWESQQTALQAERDKLFHKVATTKARSADRRVDRDRENSRGGPSNRAGAAGQPRVGRAGSRRSSCKRSSSRSAWRPKASSRSRPGDASGSGSRRAHHEDDRVDAG